MGTYQIPQGLPAGAVIPLHSSESTAAITPFSAPDASGWRWAQIRSTVAGTETLTVTVAEDSSTVTLLQNLVITFTALPPGLGVSWRTMDKG